MSYRSIAVSGEKKSSSVENVALRKSLKMI